MDDVPVSVDSVNLSTQDDSSIAQCINTHCISNAELSAEELYKHALQFYKGTATITYMGVPDVLFSDMVSSRFLHHTS